VKVEAAPVRVADDAFISAPQPSIDTRFFWESGADGFLRICRCATCRRYAHPPVPHCRHCGASRPTPTVVSGHATVFSYTISRHAFVPWQPAPYALAFVALDEQADVHLSTRLVDIAPDDVEIGLPVSVVFERHGDVYLPLFGPRRGEATRAVDAS
jgi:uncharacterized protein